MNTKFREGIFASGLYHLNEGDHSYNRVPKDSKSYIERVLSNLELPEHSLILDIGAGVGHEARAMKGLFKSRVIEIDVSYQAFAAQPDQKREFVMADANNGLLPFASGSMDLVHSKDNLIHIEDKRAYFNEVNRVLKAKGKFLLVTQCVPDTEHTNNYFSLTINGRRDDELISSYQEYLQKKEKKLKKLKDPRGVIEISPPYFETKPSEIWRLALLTGFRNQSKNMPIAWSPLRNESDWGDFQRQVFLFEKK